MCFIYISGFFVFFMSGGCILNWKPDQFVPAFYSCDSFTPVSLSMYSCKIFENCIDSKQSRGSCEGVILIVNHMPTSVSAGRI